MVAVISVDAYHFLAFSDLIYHLEDTGIARRLNVEVLTKRLSLSAGSTTVFSGVDISEVPGCHLL